MEVFMRQISWEFTETQVKLHLASVLHSPDFLDGSTATFNFHVHLLRDKRYGRPHSGTGFLSLPTDAIGRRFLALYGDGGCRSLSLGGRNVAFAISKSGQPRADVVETIRLMPYRDPRDIEEEERMAKELKEHQVPIQTIQFGWECRDGNVLSIESEDTPRRAYICFDQDRRQLRIVFLPSAGDEQEYVVAIRISSIIWSSAHLYLQREPAVVFSLADPPAYERIPNRSTIDETDPLDEMLHQAFSNLSLSGDNRPLRQQVSFLPIRDHERVAPYASLLVRLVLRSGHGLHRFKELCRLANLRRLGDSESPIVRRGLFSHDAMEEFAEWTRQIRWQVAYQVEAILRDRSVDAKEMLDILPDIKALTKDKGIQYTAAMLKSFRTKVKALFASGLEEDAADDSVRQCFQTTDEEFASNWKAPPLEPTDGSFYQSLHVTITPTAIYLDGPFPERSNRVIRQYQDKHHESFLRVTFADEGKLQYRSNDRDLDHREFVRNRFGKLLHEGLVIAKRKFNFLAYSQSALKEHSVWFVKSFVDATHGLVSNNSIIASLGTFDGLESDPQLMYCPARYAARLSQAFTATDACTIEVEEIFTKPDIETVLDGHKYCFTDGVGTISPDLAKEVWKVLKRKKRRGRSLRGYPAAEQVRFMGSKGMLSVDYRLSGFAICLRPSMIKFEAPHAGVIEIARSFDRPTPYFLNRPLIMLMEGLGVPYTTFKLFQDRAVRATQQAMRSLESAASMLETHGLGSAFRLPSILTNLNKLGILSLNEDKFYSKAMEFAIIHILRLLKYHARIPIPGAWTLVGVADIHKVLRPNEIFAYVKPLTEGGTYLHGPVLISRSPTIHPGDIQLVHAIGRPPPGSPYDKEPLANTVVFSVLGNRPVPSMLGGGDLDGDIYNLIPLSDPSLRGFAIPHNNFRAPSQYAPAERKLLDRKSTMSDVANFVQEYILSDVLGIIAINWLVIADQSPENIHDPDCLKLANLHSDAVDFPKSGNPVALTSIPRLKHKLKPDWNAPETVDASTLGNKFYRSEAAIGKLFRAIQLPAEQNTLHGATTVGSHARRRRQARFRSEEESDGYSVLGQGRYLATIERRVEGFIAAEESLVQRQLDEEAEKYLGRWTSELEGICYQHTLSSARNASLTEEEAVVGTIFQKTSQPRKRKDMIAKLREATDALVRGTREALEGGEEDEAEDYLRRAWFAWLLSLDKGTQFGARSFGLVCLGAMFSAMQSIEDREESERLSYS